MDKQCKTCGKNDHTRRSSSKCDFYIPPQKRRFNGIREKTQTFTIKCGLNKFCRRNEHLISQINKDVAEISALMIEASLLVNFHYHQLLETESANYVNDKAPNFLEFFYQLQGKRELNQEYRKIRNNENYYNGKLRSYLIQNACKTFETNVKNNITVYMYPRVKRYFKLNFPQLDKGDIYKIMKSLFQKETINQKYEQYLRAFRNGFQLEDEFTFYEMEKTWWKYINFLFKLQKFFNNFRDQSKPEDRQMVKSFNLFPIFSFGRKQILYNSDALRELLSS